MTIYELVEKLNGEITCNKAQAFVDGERVEIGFVGETELEFTEAGKALAAELEAPKKKGKGKSEPVADEGDA